MGNQITFQQSNIPLLFFKIRLFISHLANSEVTQQLPLKGQSGPRLSVYQLQTHTYTHTHMHSHRHRLGFFLLFLEPEACLF